MASDKSCYRERILLACVLGVALLGQAQAPSTAAPRPTPLAAPDKSTTFHSDLLDLSFTYPDSLAAQMLPSLDAQHAAIAGKEPANATPESRKTDECTDKALLALRNDDPRKPQATITIYGDKRGTVVNAAHAITGRILISRIGVSCMPAAYQSQLDNVATAMSAALAQDRDLRPIDQPIWYEVDKTRIHFAAGESVPAVNQPQADSDKKPESRWVGSAAFVWAGNLVSIVIESNDLPFFNEMLHSRIALGKEPAARLFPVDIGHGKQILPKPDVPPREPQGSPE